MAEICKAPRWLALAAFLAAMPATTALGNGQTSHLWITERALEHVPPGELRDLLSRDDLRPMLRNGSMFPDGGYAVGDGYGEIAHWEPLHNAYMAWILASYEPPWTDEAARHIAFWMGMASHGMADQVYDSMYMERARVYDADAPWATESMDEATDVAFAAEAGAQEVPELWVPADELAPLFLEVAGHEVAASTIRTGQAMLGFAVYYVGEAAQNPAALAEYQAQFPWATAHQLDELVAGSPPLEAQVIASYWQELWSRLHGEIGLGVMDQFPRPATYAHETSAASIESMVSIVFTRDLADVIQEPGQLVVRDADGAEHAVAVHLFYGSHVLNVRPVDDWSADAIYEVTTLEALTSFDGIVADDPLSASFTTLLAPEPPPAPEPNTCTAAPVRGGPPAALAALLAGWLGVRRRSGRR